MIKRNRKEIGKAMLAIEQALRKLPEYKSEYFKWKFNLGFRFDYSQLNEKEFLKRVKRTNINAFKRWERTIEYKALVEIYLASKSANDLLEVYNIVSKKAKQGDSNSIGQLLRLHKEIQKNAKDASKNFNGIVEKTKFPTGIKLRKEYDDGLIV